MIGALLNAALALGMATGGRRRWLDLREALADPARAQARTLADILAAGRDTRFGREHGFTRIAGARAFADAVPVQDYETLRPLIEAQERSGEPLLNPRQPLMYTQTSGTTGAPKLIPVLPATLAGLVRNQAIQAYRQYAFDPRAYHGRLMFVASPAMEGRLDTGTPYGSASGHVTASLPAAARAKYLLPQPVFETSDYDLKYLLIVRLALGRADITCMGSANPSTFLKLLAVLAENREQLTSDVTRGRFGRFDELPEAVRAAVSGRLAVDRARAAQVREALQDPAPSFAALWPRLRLLTTWTGGSCAVALDSLRPQLPETTHVAELGYLSSECRGTLNVDVGANLCVPLVDENFYEFVEVARHEAGNPEFLGLEALEPGRDYHVLVTTRGGLYRYFMNDVLTVTGRYAATPALRFVRKGRGVTSITGEKLTENQVVDSVSRACSDTGRRSPFYLMLADPGAACYRLLVEWVGPGTRANALGEAAERHLGKVNVEYREKRASGRLGALEVVPLAPGAGDAYKRSCLQRGQRESQFKVLVLQTADECHFDYEALRLRA